MLEQTTKHIRAFSAIILVISLLGCQGVLLTDAKPAQLAESTETVREQLKKIISQETGISQIRISDNALMNSSFLIIERTTRQTISNPDLNGRELLLPYRFQLLIKGEQCFLVINDKNKHWLLNGVKCLSIESAS